MYARPHAALGPLGLEAERLRGDPGCVLGEEGQTAPLPVRLASVPGDVLLADLGLGEGQLVGLRLHDGHPTSGPDR